MRNSSSLIIIGLVEAKFDKDMQVIVDKCLIKTVPVAAQSGL